MKKYIILLIAVTAFMACKKKNVSPVQFDVNVSKTTFKVGDTVAFNITGNPDYITYYSGDVGNDYAYRDRAIFTGKVTMSFTSRLTQGSTDPTKQQNTLRVLFSDHFISPTPGFLIDSTNVVNADANTWTDITNRFILPTVPSSSSINSGIADITDLALAAGGKPCYIAFKYTDVSDPVQSQRYWFLTNLTVDNTLPNGNKINDFLLINRSSIQLFNIINIKNPDVKWTIGSSSAQISIVGGGPNTASNEDWMISRPIYLSAYPADAAIPVKTLSDNPVNQVTKVYKTPGTYNVVFIAKNGNIYDQQEITKQISITVTP